METIKQRKKIRNALLLISFLLFPVTLNYFSPVLPIVGALNGVIVGSLLLHVVLLLSALFLRQSFCAWICPSGAMQDYCANVNPKKVKGEKVDAIKINSSDCCTCKVCSFNCPMSLPVHELVNKGNIEHSEYILCGNCVDTCKKQVIKYTFKK